MSHQSSSDEMVLNGERYGLGATLHAEFGQDATHVELDSRAADDESLGDLGVVQPLHYEGQDFALAWAEIVAAWLRLRGALNERLCCLGRKRRLSCPRGADRSRKLIDANVFEQITQRTCLQHV